jgi:hypothetical protein
MMPWWGWAVLGVCFVIGLGAAWLLQRALRAEDRTDRRYDQ